MGGFDTNTPTARVGFTQPVQNIHDKRFLHTAPSLALGWEFAELSVATPGRVAALIIFPQKHEYL